MEMSTEESMQLFGVEDLRRMAETFVADEPARLGSESWWRPPLLATAPVDDRFEMLPRIAADRTPRYRRGQFAVRCSLRYDDGPSRLHGLNRHGNAIVKAGQGIPDTQHYQDDGKV